MIRAAALAGLMIAAAPSPSEAQDVAAAKALFDRGFDEMQKGEYAAGCPRLAESHRLDPRPGTLFTLAICESKWGRSATAVARLDEYLRLYEQLSGDQKTRQAARAAEAKKERDRLAPEVPELTLTLPKGAPPETIIRRDNILMGAAMMGVPLPVDPGEHTLSTQSPEGLVWETRITLAKSEKRSIELEIRFNNVEPEPPPPAPSAAPSAAPVAPAVSSSPTAAELIPSSTPLRTEPPREPPPKPPPEPSNPGAGQRGAGYAMISLGIAGLVGGGVFGGLAFGARDELRVHCGTAVGADDPKACDKAGVDAGVQMKSFALASTIGFAVGGGLLGLGIVVFASAPKARDAEPPSKILWLRGGVMPVGPDGAGAFVSGAF